MRLLLALLLLTAGTPNRAPPTAAPPLVSVSQVGAAAGDSGEGTASVTYRLPVAAPLRVTRDFDPPATRFGRGHRGVDLAAPAGSAVLAAADGVVSYAGELAGRIVISVTHADGIRTTYEPMASLTVHLHAKVLAGDRLGTVAPGHPGCSAVAPMVCLHWGALRPGPSGSTYIDPLLLLDHEPVTLLPPIGISPGS